MQEARSEPIGEEHKLGTVTAQVMFLPDIGHYVIAVMDRKYGQHGAVGGKTLPTDAVVQQAEAMKKLLSLIASPGICKGCAAPVWWVRHNNGANVPYTSAGLNHFVNCPEREQFRKNRSAR